MVIPQAYDISGILRMQEQWGIELLRCRKDRIKIGDVKVDAVHVRAERRSIEAQFDARTLQLARGAHAVLQWQRRQGKKSVGTGVPHLGKSVVHRARDPLADFGSRPVREELWRRADGGRIELAPIHFGEDQATIEELRAKGRPRLHRHVSGSVEYQFGCCFRIVDVDHAVKVVAPRHVDEQGRQDVKMNIDGRHGFMSFDGRRKGAGLFAGLLFAC
jgi:hypothetical protein